MVSTAERSGVRLGKLLRMATPLPNARAVRLSGSHGYQRVIPLSKALHPDSLIADLMNGETLPQIHGPLRALVPEWYGMDSVKWLREVDLLARGENQTYVRQYRNGRTERITEMTVKAVFGRPLDGAVLSRRPFVIHGDAWAGEKRIRRFKSARTEEPRGMMPG